MKNTSIECICHGISGACSIKTCFKKVPDIEQLGTELLKKYDVAKNVKVRDDKLHAAGNTVPELRKDELAYISFSPNFCKRDLKNGMLGTSGRRCYRDRNDYSSCASLCCGGAVEQRVVAIKEDPNKCCFFQWCCFLNCTACATYNEIHYFCK